jgi:hypothetical protein
MSSRFGFGILVIVFLSLVSFAPLGQTQTYQSFTWASNGVSNIVVPTAEVWEIITWGTKTSSANGLNTLYALPGGLTLSYTTNVFYTKINKADSTENPCGTVLVGPTTITRIANAKASDYLLVIQKLSTNNTTNNTTNSTIK